MRTLSDDLEIVTNGGNSRATAEGTAMTGKAYSRADITLANWRQHPFSEWSFQNVPELVPTAEITPPRAAEDLVAEPGLIASLSIHEAGRRRA